MNVKSLFVTKTFQGALLSLVLGIAPIAVRCAYQKQVPSENDAIAIVALAGTFTWALIGRVQPAAYTPQGLPGPNKSDLEGEVKS